MDSLKLENQFSDIVYTKGNPILNIKISSFQYDDQVILRDINILEYDVHSTNRLVGQSIAILGRSGRGKSTLFRVISGLEQRPTTEIVLDIDNKPTFVKEGMVGMIDQKYTLFRHKTVEEIFKFASNRNKKNKLDFVQYAEAWDLDKHLKKYPHELSGGQRQRVAILEKILLGNHFLILDEPISGLDVVAIDNVIVNMKKILSEDDKNTLIFSTHDINFAYQMADVIYIIGHEKDKVGSTVLKKFDRRFGDVYDVNDIYEVLKNS